MKAAYGWCQALGAEIVAVFEGSSEHGGVFQARQSYLAREIHWGFQFRPITQAAPAGSTRHEVDISRCVHCGKARALEHQ